MAASKTLTLIIATQIFLSLTILGTYMLAQNSKTMQSVMEPLLTRGIIDTPRGPVTLIRTFWHVKFLDELWYGVTSAFSISQFEVDTVSSWQMFGFLADAAPIYVVWLMESYRRGSSWSTALGTSVFGMGLQIASGAIIAPLYYLLNLFTCPSVAVLTPATRRLDMASLRVLPLTLLVIFYIPFFGSYTSPSFESRNWWNWVWQMFPLWIAVTQFLLTSLLPIGSKTSNVSQEKFWVRLTVIPPALISSAVWVYTWIKAPYTMGEIFLPTKLIETEVGLLALRTLLRWDWVIFFGSTVVWLCFLAADLKRSGFVRYDWYVWAIVLVPMVGVVGPGATITGAWLLREEVIMTNVRGLEVVGKEKL